MTMASKNSSEHFRLDMLQKDLNYIRSEKRTAMEITLMWSKYKSFDINKEYLKRNKRNKIAWSEYTTANGILASIISHQNAPKWIRDAWFREESYRTLSFSEDDLCSISDSFVKYLISAEREDVLIDAILNSSFSKDSLLEVVNTFELSKKADLITVYDVVTHPNVTVQLLELALEKAGTEFVYSLPVDASTSEAIDWAWEKYEKKELVFKGPGEEFSFLVEFVYNENSSTAVLCKLLKHMSSFNPVEVNSLIQTICEGKVSVKRFDALVKEGWGNYLAMNFSLLIMNKMVPAEKFIELADGDTEMINFFLKEKGENRKASQTIRRCLINQLRETSPELESAPDDMLLKVYNYS